jgi:hypothetical protein
MDPGGKVRREWMLGLRWRLGGALQWRARWPLPKQLRHLGGSWQWATLWSVARHQKHLPLNCILYSCELLDIEEDGSLARARRIEPPTEEAWPAAPF